MQDVRVRSFWPPSHKAPMPDRRLPLRYRARYQKRASAQRVGNLTGGGSAPMADFVETNSAGIAPSRPRATSIEGRGSWVAAGVPLALLSVSYGSPLLVVVGLKPITEDLGTERQVV